jgi:hypothetical protein
MYLINELFHPSTRKTYEAWLKGLEEARQAALEMAKEENEAPEESAEDAQGLSTWEYGVTRHPRGLQLQG